MDNTLRAALTAAAARLARNCLHGKLSVKRDERGVRVLVRVDERQWSQQHEDEAVADVRIALRGAGLDRDDDEERFDAHSRF